MAVQAQYPSNVHLLNRNTQGKNTIGNDYSFQQHTNGGGTSSTFLDQQPHIQFNSLDGNNNTKKRSRELMALQQSQPPNQIINLSLLHTPQNHPNNVVSTGLRLSFGDQLQHQKQHPMHHQTQQNQLSLFSSQTSQESSLFLPFSSNDFSSHIKQQQQEIENFITFQGEQLRHGLAEKRRRNLRSLIIAAEESVARKLKEKEVEVEKAYKINAELEARAAQLEAEAQAWQARAREHEITRTELQAQIQQAMLGRGRDGFGYGGGNNGGEVVAAEAGVVAEDEESVYIDPDRVQVMDGPSCKGCGRGVASMVLLPCRHLCLCIECDGVARCCPLCYTFRSSSVEVIMG